MDFIYDVCNSLNIKYEKHKYFNDGVSSKVMLINDKYLVKENTVEELKGEVLYLNANVSEIMQKVIYVDEDYKYVVFDFIKGNVMKDVVDIEDLLKKLSKVVFNYKPTNIEGFGYMDDIKISWKEFLLDEISSCDNLKEYIPSDEYVKKCIDNLEKYPFNKSIIHGDFGTHNFIEYDGKLKGIIDPQAILGDPIYDLLFAIVSNVDILSTLTLDDIYALAKEDNNKIHDLLVVVLYSRISRCLKYHPQDISIYIDFYNKISL